VTRDASSSSLPDAIHGAHPEDALALAAGRMADGESPRDLARELVSAALALSGGELHGATWSHAVLATLAAVELDARGIDVRSALVGLAGFLAHARPSRIGDGRSASQDVPALEAAALKASGGWGHAVLVLGHAGRAQFLRQELLAAAARYLVPPEPGPERAADAVRLGSSDDAELVATSVIAAGEAPLELTASREALAEGLALAAAELLRRAPDLRGIHHITVLRECLLLSDAPRALGLAARFIADGWERARRDRRGKGAVSFVRKGDGVDAATIAELLEVEPRPGFGHNVKLVAAALALQDVLPPSIHPALGAAVRATVPTWSRSRRPWLALQAARRAL